MVEKRLSDGLFLFILFLVLFISTSTLGVPADVFDLVEPVYAIMEMGAARDCKL